MSEEPPVSANLMTFAIPGDEKLLAAFGTVSIVHAQLDHIMKMLIKTLTNLSVREIMQGLHRAPSSEIRDRAKKIARTRLGEGPAFIRVEGWVNRHRELTERRNELIHSLIGKPLSGDNDAAPVFYSQIDDNHRPIPKTQEVDRLVNEMLSLIAEINVERLHGFLSKVLAEKPAPKGFE